MSSALRDLDEFAYALYGLGPEDACVIDGVLLRSRSMFLDSDLLRAETVAPAYGKEVAAYAATFMATLDRVLARDSYHRVNAMSAVSFGSRTLGLKVALAPGGRRPTEPFRIREPELFEAAVFRGLHPGRLIPGETGRLYSGFREGELYILKPAELRLWTLSEAQSDGRLAGEEALLRFALNASLQSKRALH